MISKINSNTWFSAVDIMTSFCHKIHDVRVCFDSVEPSSFYHFGEVKAFLCVAGFGEILSIYFVIPLMCCVIVGMIWERFYDGIETPIFFWRKICLGQCWLCCRELALLLTWRRNAGFRQSKITTTKYNKYNSGKSSVVDNDDSNYTNELCVSLLYSIM